MTIATETPAASLRTPALVGGLGILVLAALSGWANFGVVEALVTDGDAARTARDVLASPATFRLGVGALVVTAILDIVVGWALWAFFAPVNAAVSAIAGASRAIYGGVFLVAAGHLLAALEILESAAADTAFTTDQLATLAMQEIASFQHIWNVGLVLFGLHLVLSGYLACRSTYAPRWLGRLLALAGVGYVLDSGGALLAPGALPEVAAFTFIGEALLIVWLLTKGRRATTNAFRSHP